MIKSALLAFILLILSVTSFAKGDGVETNRISRLQYELHAAGLPFDPEAVIQGYKQAFGLSDPEIEKDLEGVLYDSTLTMHQRANAFLCYLHLTNEKQAENDSLLKDSEHSTKIPTPPEIRIQSLRRSLGTYTPVETWAFLASYYREFNADENCLRRDLAAIAQDKSIGILSREQAFCAYADLAGDDALDFESTIQPDDILRETCMRVAVRQATDIDRALDRTRMWMLDKMDSERSFDELQSITSAWMAVYDYREISLIQKSAIVKAFREILNQATNPLPIICANMFLAKRDPEYTTSGLRAETIGKWMSRTNEAPVAFQERCSRYFLRAAKEANIILVSVPNPQTDAVEETNRTETDDLNHGSISDPAEPADATAPSTEADSREPHEKHPWWFVGLALVFGWAAWWRFHRKTKG